MGNGSSQRVVTEDPETKVEMALRLLAEAEDDIARQDKVIADLKRDGRTTVGAETLLEMLKEARTKAQSALNLLRKVHP